MSEKEEEAIPIEEGTAKQVQQLGRGNRDPVKKTTRIDYRGRGRSILRKTGDEMTG